jgi:membrane associated rhomboid family serine protease
MSIFRYYPDNPEQQDKILEKKILIHSLIFPLAFVILFWMVEITEQVFGLNFVPFGIFPLQVKGLKGILFSPFVHSDYNHLMANSLPFFILLAALVYYYRKIAYRIFFLIYLISGLCVWLGGRPAWHIGASGVIYGLAAFHLVSGILRNDIRLLTLSVLVVFLYGSMFWGVFPLRPDISWEAHLWGALSGVLLAVYYRKYALRRKKFDWEEEPDEENKEPGPENGSYFSEPTFSSETKADSKNPSNE